MHAIWRVARRDRPAGRGGRHDLLRSEGGSAAADHGGDAFRDRRTNPDTASPFDALPESVRLAMDKPFTGDFDTMVTRRAIRVGVTFNRTHYFIDKGQERLTYESLKLFENDLNADLKTGNLKVNVVIVPMLRNQLYPALASGKVDMVAAMVTVRPELEKLVAFSVPTRTNVSQVVVTGPGASPIVTVDGSRRPDDVRSLQRWAGSLWLTRPA